MNALQKIRWLLIVFATGGTIVFCILIICADDGINPAVCSRIAIGMTLDEAIFVVGKKPGWYRREKQFVPDFRAVNWRNDAVEAENQKIARWFGQQYVLFVELDQTDRVVLARCQRPIGFESF